MTTAKRRIKGYAVAGLLFAAAECGAASDFFVAPAGGHQAPYASWGTAATNVRDAVMVANASNTASTVWVSNGLYRAANMITISNAVVRGFGGDRTAVVIDGGGSVRPFYLNHAGAALRDLTVSNGYVSSTADLSGNGGGVYVDGTSAMVSNCAVISCTATNFAGGIHLNKGLVRDCLVACNVCQSGGGNGAAGGLFVGTDGLAVSCTISNNQALAGTLHGVGGVYLSTRAAISNSTVVGNFGCVAGGIKTYVSGRISNCDIRGNMASNATQICGGGIYTDKPAIMRNCLVRNNIVYHGASGNPAAGGVRTAMSGADVFELQACTIVSNVSLTAYTGNGGAYLNGTNILTGCIIYGNKSGFSATWDTYNFVIKACTNLAFNNCVERPLSPLPFNQGNITNSPLFVDSAQRDYHLAANSPCINTGTNLSWMADALDLGGNPRLDRRYRLADMGCYETVFLPSGGTLFSLQ